MEVRALTRKLTLFALLALLWTPVNALLVEGEIRVMTSGAFASAHAALSPQFARATKNTVVTVTTSTGVGAESIPSRLARGDAADVVILPEANLDALIRKRLVAADSKVPLARSAIGMGVRTGAPKPDIGTVDALTRTLLAAKAIAFSASVSGDYLSTELFPRLGIADQLKARSQRIERERVGAVVARGEAEIGFQQMSELLEVPGVDLVGPLPADAQRITVVAAGIAVGSKNPDGARALIRYFASPEHAAALRTLGLEPIGSQ
jgi:molybdate transport system substrate-binding protein